MTWIAPEVDRVRVRPQPDEGASLRATLAFNRQTLLLKCAGLTHDQLVMRSVPPSRLSLLGLVRHMTDVERWWFRTNLRGERLEGIFGPDDNLEGDFEDLDSASAEDVFIAYAEECAAADAAATGLPLTTTFRGLSREYELDLRWVYQHMIEEYARHNGHADLLRECIDGVVGY